MLPTARAALLTVALLALAACGDGETTSPLTDATPATSTESSAPAADDAAVDIDDFRFAPETVSVTVGTEVTWTNQDATAHTVTAGSEDAPDPDAFDLEVTAQGDTVSTTFEAPGSYAYYCELHPFMTGTVEVTG